MVLVTCPECQSSVSSQAAVCPHCGFSLGRSPLLPGPAGPEEMLWQGSPSLALIAGRIAGALLALVVFPVAAVLIHAALLRVAAGGSRPLREFLTRNDRTLFLLLLAAAALVVVPSVASVVKGIVQVKSLRYTLSNQRILVEKGLFAKTLEEVDLRYVDETQFSQGLVDRILGIGSVRVASTDALTPRLVLVGVRDPRGVREKLRAAAYQVSQRQFFTRST